MKAGLLLTGSGALVYLTSHKKYIDDTLVDKFRTKGITKFLAYEVDPDDVRRKYGSHFDVVQKDLRESDDLRILDYDGVRAFRNFSFEELGKPFQFEEK